MLREPAQLDMLREPAQLDMLREPAQLGMLWEPAQLDMLREPAQLDMLVKYALYSLPKVPPTNSLCCSRLLLRVASVACAYCYLPTFNTHDDTLA